MPVAFSELPPGFLQLDSRAIGRTEPLGADEQPSPGTGALTFHLTGKLRTETCRLSPDNRRRVRLHGQSLSLLVFGPVRRSLLPIGEHKNVTNTEAVFNV